MTVLDAIHALARGERSVDAILPPCRLEGLGTAAYGEEAIIKHFRENPIGSLASAEVLQTQRHIAVFLDKTSLFADVYGGRLLRIWHLADQVPVPFEPALGVPFDTDLSQKRKDVAGQPEDHPELNGQAYRHVMSIGYELAHKWCPGDGAPAWRSRPFLLRAFSSGGQTAALFAIHRLGSKSERSSGFAFAAASFGIDGKDVGDVRLVRDKAGEAAVESRNWRTSF